MWNTVAEIMLKIHIEEAEWREEERFQESLKNLTQDRRIQMVLERKERKEKDRTEKEVERRHRELINAIKDSKTVVNHYF